MKTNKTNDAVTGPKSDKMKAHYFFELIYITLTICYFLSHPINMSEPLDLILILIPVFWISISFLIYKKEK